LRCGTAIRRPPRRFRRFGDWGAIDPSLSNVPAVRPARRRRRRATRSSPTFRSGGSCRRSVSSHRISSTRLHRRSRGFRYGRLSRRSSGNRTRRWSAFTAFRSATPIWAIRTPPMRSDRACSRGALGWSTDDFDLSTSRASARSRGSIRTPDEVFHRLGSEGTRRIIALCPGFTATAGDDRRDRQPRQRAIPPRARDPASCPCLNDRPRWIDAMADLAWDELQGWFEHPIPVLRFACHRLIWNKLCLYSLLNRL